MAATPQAVAQVVAAYWVVSISMVYLNKVLLTGGNATIQAPLFITMFQAIISCVICVTLGNVGESHRRAKTSSFASEWSQISWSLSTSLAVLPLSAIFVGMVALNNLCLQFVEVSFYNVARCLSLVFNVILSYAVLGKPTSLSVCATLMLVIVGFFLGIDGEVNFSLLGTLFGVLSSLFVSLSSIFTAKVLPAVSNDKSLLIFYNNLNATLLLLPLVVVFEGRFIMAHVAILSSLAFWLAMSVAAVLGFSVALVTVLQIKYTSPLTHNISGTAKAAVQSLGAFFIWGNAWTVTGVVGLFLVLVGSAMYAVIVMRESEREATTAKPPGRGSIQRNRDEEEEEEEEGGEEDGKEESEQQKLLRST